MRKTLALLLVFVCLIGLVVLPARAYEVAELSAWGTVTTSSSNLNMRSGPGTSYGIVSSLVKGSIVRVTGVTKDTSQNDWYRVSADGKEGFVMAKFITLREAQQGEDADFETTLELFPVSYHEKLRTLHTLHPAWRFTPLMTNLDWNDVMANEWVIGRNLLQSPDAWKSYDKGAYDWENKKWYAFDSGGWVQALKEVIAYYMDPRNFLDSNIYQFLVLDFDESTVNETVVRTMLAGTFMENGDCGGISYPQAIVSAGMAANCSPYLLAARIRLEQGSVGNKLAHGTVPGYEGYYNHFDIGAYAHSGRTAIVNGAIYAKNKGWNTPYKAILGGAQFLVNSYVGVGQNTLYLQKYDVVDGGNGYYNHQYMTSVSAGVLECAPIRNAIVGSPAEESPLEFLIPVYNNMPAEPCPAVPKTGNGNNYLKSLSIEGVTLRTPFDRYTFEYEQTLSERQSITITAVPEDAGAVVSGAGTRSLHGGMNEITITVRATNGFTRDYTLYLTLPGETPPDEPTPTPAAGGTPSPTATVTPTPTSAPAFQSAYQIKDDLLLGIPVGETRAAFLAKQTVSGYTISLQIAAGSEKPATSAMATGDRLVLTYNGQQTVYTIVVFGDSNGDGKLNSADLLRTQKAILGLSAFTNAAQREAADFTRDSTVNSRDLLACQKRILGLS